MSALRLLPLLALVVVLCACLPLSVVGQDPTTGCYSPLGDSSYGTLVGDAGYYHLVGLEYYASTNYNILCSFRALYDNGPSGQVNVWGPWHGNPGQDPTVCTGPTQSIFTISSDWAQAGAGSYSSRTNAANGKTVMVSFTIGRVCSFQDYICAGVGCPGNPNYAAEMAALRADPTYQVHNFSTSGSGPANTVQVISKLNATASINTAIRSSNQNIYPDRVLSVVTSVQLCYGYKTITC